MNHPIIHTTRSGFINSYSQLFFADSKAFAWLLLVSSFVNPVTGISGVLATVFALLFGYWIGLDRYHLSLGTFSYNSLMVGLVLGSQYSLTPAFLFVLACSSLLSVVLTVWLNTILLKYKVPSLSLAFLLTLWLITIGLRSYDNVAPSESGLFRLNEWYSLGGGNMVEWMNALDDFALPEILSVYLKSLSAVFFQYNLISGIITLIGLLIWSRIAFLLSIVGFTIGYLFYATLAGEFTQLYYSYIGFNFILTSIALGGFYVVPSRSSFLLAILTMPMIGILISGLSGLLAPYQLPLYSLPFAITVILVLMLLHQRVFHHRLILVPFQYFSPEKNLYYFSTRQKRFERMNYIPMRPPFFGEWYISQGYDGQITHRDEWQHALDFVVVDETQHTFRLPGKNIEDFYCYNLPVLAPADGYVIHIIDGIEDNAIGEIDVQHNWGNTIIIKHAEGLYSKLSHLKKGSFTVRMNDYVSAGHIIGYCGSSGRSPEPHLHFQLQSTPYIGSKTLPYPLGYSVSRQNDQYTLHEYSIPEEGMHLHFPVQTPLLIDAFKFVPGKTSLYESTDANGNKQLHRWECYVNSWNETYLYSPDSQSAAYFVNNGTVFYFTRYEGNKADLLYEFYLAAHKMLLGYYEQLPVTDHIALPDFLSSKALWLQDFTAPFIRFFGIQYTGTYIEIDSIYAPQMIRYKSQVTALFRSTMIKSRSYEMTFKEGRLDSWTIHSNHTSINTIQCIEF